MAPATLLYDGDCGFCTSSAGLLRRWVPTPARIEAWQFVAIEALGVTPAQCADALQWVAGTRRASGPAAVAAVLRSSTGAWRLLGRLLETRLLLALSGPVYRWVARNRHRMPGGTPACAVRRGDDIVTAGPTESSP